MKATSISAISGNSIRSEGLAMLQSGAYGKFRVITNSQVLLKSRIGRRIIGKYVFVTFTAVLVLSVAAAPVSGQKLPVLVDDWGVWGHGDGQFANIGDVAVDASANVYVADRFNNRIQKFDSDGKFIAKWGSWGSGDGQFIFPPGLAVTASGNVYVADQFNNRVQKFDSNGNFITKWGSEGTGNGQFSAPQDVAVDGSGNVFVADSGNNRIQKFDNSGQFLLKWGTEGSANKQFSVPTGVEVDHLGNVYVADFFNHRIQKFDGSGQYLDQWGTPGHGGGQFVFPHGVAVDGNGNVYVTDQSNHRIQKFDGSGTLLMKWGCEGSSDCQFDYPTGIAVDKWGYVYVADFGNSRIQKFGPEPVEFMYLQPLKEYSDNGTDRVYRRGLKNFFNVQMIIPQGYTNPQLQITDAGKPEGTTNVKIIGPKVLGNVAQFRLDVPDNNPVGTYRIRGILTSGAKKLKTCELPVYVIFDVPKSMVADKASVKAYLYDEAGHRDEKSYQFSWHYGSTNKGGGKWWARDWPESGYVLNPFDKGLFAMVIRAVNGQTMESQVAEDLMWAISNVIMYVGTNPCKNVAKMLGGAVDADLFAKAYGPQGEETQFIQGQCLDYAHGLSAVLRSIGIPTRVATKIESSGFSYHEWTETFLENPPSGTDKWYYYDAMDYTHSPSADLTKPPVGSFARMTSPFSSSAFEILVGDTSWKIDGAVQITETAMLPNKRVGVQRLGTNANDALFEKCEKKHYNPSDCPDIDPPALGLVTITLDQDRYRIRDPITATVHVTNPEPQEQSFDLSFRFYVVDAEDDGRDAFGDPVLDMPGSGISGETLFEERELLTVPAGSSAERVYEFQVEDMDLPSDQHWAEAVASGDLGTDVHAVDIPVDPGYDQVIAYDPRDPALGDELVLTLTLTNRLTFPLTELSVNFEMPEFFSTSDMLHAEVGDLEPGEEIAFDWVFAPVGENIPTLQHFRLIVNTENGGNLVEPLEVELRRPPMPRILPISVPPTVLVGEVFQISYEIENIGDGPLYDARVALSLPEGVAALEEALPQSIGDVPPGENAVVTWALVSEIVGVQLFVITVEDEAGVVLSERPDLVEIIMEEPDLPLDSPAGGEGYIGIWEVIDNGEINDQGACYASLNSGEGSIASHWKSVLNLWDSGGNGHFGSDDGFAVVDMGYREQGSVDDLSLIARGTIRIPAGQGGFWTFGVNSDDGLTLQLPGQNFISAVNGEIMHFESGAALRFYGDRGAADTLGLIELLPGNYPFWLTYHEGGGDASVEFFAGKGNHTTFIPEVFHLVGGPGGLELAAPRLISDVTGDGVVNYEDFDMMTEEWLARDDLMTDLHPDGKIDFVDFAIFADQWKQHVTVGLGLSSPAPVNTNAGTDSADDKEPRVATDGKGNWVVVWQSSGGFGSDSDILFSRSVNDGQGWSPVAALNSNASSDSAEDVWPRVAADGKGNWVVVWQSSGFSGTDSDILFSRSADNGNSWSPVAALNLDAALDGTYDAYPALAADGKGNWVVVWQGSLGGLSGADLEIVYSHSADHGKTWSYPFALNKYASSDSATDLTPDVACDGTGNWIAVWASDYNTGGIGTDYDILFSCSTTNGKTWGAAAAANSNADTDSASDMFPEIAKSTGWNWVVVWHSSPSYGPDFDILFAQTQNGGLSWYAPKLVNDYGKSDTTDDTEPCTAGDGTGAMVTVWTTDGDPNWTIGKDVDTLLSYSKDDGRNWSNAQPLNLTATVDTAADSYPDIAGDGKGTWLAVWYSTNNLGGTGSDCDIFVTRFKVP